MKKIIILVFLILISCGVNESSNIDSDSTTKTTIDILILRRQKRLNIFSEKTYLLKDLSHVLLENCIDFLGSYHRVECMQPYKQVKVDIGGTPVNLYKQDGKLYIVLKEGKYSSTILKLKNIN